MRFLKKTFKYVFITLFVLLIALVSIPYLFHSKIKVKILKEIDANINARVNFTEMDLSSFKKFPRLTITLHDACVSGINEFEGDTLFSSKEISFSFDVYTLIKGRNFEINGIDLEEPLIYARILKNGKANYDIVKTNSSKKDTGQSRSFNLNIDKWSINNGRIVYDDKLQKTYIEVGGLVHSGSGDFEQEISDLDITTRVSDLTLVYNGIKYFDKKLFEADLLMEMNLKEKKFIFKDHTFQLGDFKFAFNGFFKLLKNGYQTDLNLVVKETSFKSLLSLLPGVYQKDLAGIKTNGEFSFTGYMKGIYDVKDKVVPTFHADLKVKDAMFKYSHLPKAVEHINLHLLADNPDGVAEHTTIDLRVFHFEMDKTPVHGSIRIKGQKNMFVVADIKLKADLAEIEKFYPLDGLVLRGNLNSEIKINGNYNDSLKLFPKVDAFLTLNKGYLKYKDEPLEMDSIHLDTELLNNSGQLADTRVTINNMTFLLDDEPFVLSGNILDLKDYNYNLNIDGLVDLEKLTKLYPIPNSSIKGSLNFDIRTQGNLTELEAKDYTRLKTEGTLEAKNISYKTDELAVPVHLDDALFTFSPDKIILNRFKAEFGKSNISLSGHLFNYIPYLIRHDAPINGDLTMSVDTFDLNEWFPQTASTGTMQATKNDTLSAGSQQVLVIPGNIGFIIDSDIKQVKFGSMNINNLDGEIKIQNGILTLNETGFNTLDSKITMSGDYNTRDEKHPVFDMLINIESLDINKAYRAFVDPKGMAPAQGNFSTLYNLKGELKPDFTPITSTLLGKGKITMDKVSVKGMKLFNHIKKVSKKEAFSDPELNDISMNTEIKKGRFVIYPFSFKAGKFLTEVEGSQTFSDTMNYLIKLSVPPFNKLKIPISIIGTSDKPEIKMGKGFDRSVFDQLE